MEQKRKNILFILTDDQGAWAMHCAGNDDIYTPNLDRIAKEGMRFENFFCVSPVCSPARASLLTGKIPSAHGVHDWLAKGQIDHDSLSDELKEAFLLDDPPSEYVWPKHQLCGDTGVRYLDGHKTFTEVLHDNGYECSLSGKWHIGAADQKQAGFDNWYTCAIGGGDYWNQVMLENGKMEMKKGEYVTDIITDHAIEFLKERDREKPFCLSVHYTAPHSPWGIGCHKEEYEEMYKDCTFPSIPEEPPHRWVEHVDQSFEDWKKVPHPGVRFIRAQYAPIRETWSEYRLESLRGYFAAVSAMDAAVGRLLDALDAEGVTEDTLLVFTSDNGSNMGHHGIFGKGNGTYPVNMYETSVKVPGLFRCPGTVPSGVVTDAMCSHYDVYETLLDFAGIDFEKTPDMPGESFADLLRTGETGERGERRIVVFDEYGRTRMARNAQYKYVKRYPTGPDELYDLVNDPNEKINLIDLIESDGGLRAVWEDLHSQLDAWFLKYVNPEIDGSLEDVRGHGQYGRHYFR